MENESVSTATSGDNRPKRKADDFDPEETTGGPNQDDRPRPPSSYDLETTPTPSSSDVVKK